MNFDAIFERTQKVDITEQDTKKIKVKNPGILSIPDGKHFYSVPLKHYIDLAKSKGKGPVMKALNNLVRWNKNDDPELSSKAKSIVDKLKDNPQWEKVGVKEGQVEEFSASKAVDLRFKHQELKKKKSEEKPEEMDEAVNEEYNGWTNWETWNVDVWMTNDEGNYNMIRSGGPYDANSARELVMEVFPEGTPDMDPGELENVNWDEVANSFNEMAETESSEEEAEMEERIKEKVEKAMKEGTINFIGGFDQIGFVRKMEEGKWKVQTYEAFAITEMDEAFRKELFEESTTKERVIEMFENTAAKQALSVVKGKNEMYPDGYLIGFNENRLVTVCEITEDELKSMMNESGNFEPTIVWLLEKLEPLAEAQRISGHWIPALYDFPIKEEEKPFKSVNASKVLRLMDEDFSYSDAVKKISEESGVSIEQLEKELEPFI